MHTKPSIRKHFLKIRKSIPEPQAKKAAIKAAGNFIRFIKIKGVKKIAFYHPANGEIDPFPLFARLLSNAHIPLWQRVYLRLVGRKLLKPLHGKFKSQHENIIFSLPKITHKNEHLVFHPWKIGEGLVGSSIYPQILEPESGAGHVIPDIIIVPLVAFDENCNRIGYGGGFYDRTLAKLEENKKVPITVGYAYECQKSIEPLPTDEHDIQLDFVVTEKRVYAGV